MQDKSSKGIILTKIRNALINTTEQPFPTVESLQNIYKGSDDEPVVQFAKEFTEINGQFVFNESFSALAKNLSELAEAKSWNHLFCWHKEFLGNLQDEDFRKVRFGKDISKADVGITGCELFVARTGSVFLSSAMESGRSLSIFPPVHIIIGYTDQVVENIGAGFMRIKEKYPDMMPSMINLVSGPSRTADIEKTLVLGAHGPKEIYVFMLPDSARK